MSKKGCLITAVIVIILVIILLSCAAVCVLFGEAFSNYDLNSLDAQEGETIVDGGDDKVAVIKIEGLIMDVEAGSDLWGTTYASSQQIVKYLDNVIADDNIKAVILNIDSPGGDVYATDTIYNKVKEVQEAGIKVITLMRNTAASGGYYIAASSDVIIASPVTITGSIGVRADLQSLGGLYEKLGIETRTITNSGGDYKTGEGFFDDDPEGEEDQILQRIVDEYYDRFVTIVVEGRSIERDKLLEIADGRIFSGKQAQNNGLVDELGDFNVAIAAAEKEAGISNATVIEYKDYDFWNMLASYAGNIANPTASFIKLIDPTPGVKLKYLYTE